MSSNTPINNLDTPSHAGEGCCANCGATLSGQFCQDCGQAAEDIRRPAWGLLTDLIGSIFVWEGKFFTTLRRLYSEPGRVARDYVDGRRQSHTAPIRIYLIISLMFFLAMSAAGVRVIGVDISPTPETVRAQASEVIAARTAQIEAAMSGSDATASTCGVMPGPDEINASGRLVYSRDTSLQIELFQFGAATEGRVLPDNPACRTEFDLPGSGLSLGRASRFAVQYPSVFEDQVVAAAAQSLILMVIAFAFLNLLVHPKRRLIEHVIYSLYWHAAYLPIMAGLVVAGRMLQNSPIAIICLAVLGIGLVLGFQVLCDRGFYRSSWIGAILRSFALQLGYILCIGVLAIGLILTAY